MVGGVSANFERFVLGCIILSNCLAVLIFNLAKFALLVATILIYLVFGRIHSLFVPILMIVQNPITKELHEMFQKYQHLYNSCEISEN